MAEIKVVISRAGTYVWACGGARAEVRRTARGRRFGWRWRVWRVLKKPESDLAGGLALTMESATKEALHFLERTAANG